MRQFPIIIWSWLILKTWKTWVLVASNVRSMQDWHHVIQNVNFLKTNHFHDNQQRFMMHILNGSLQQWFTFCFIYDFWWVLCVSMGTLKNPTLYSIFFTFKAHKNPRFWTSKNPFITCENIFCSTTKGQKEQTKLNKLITSFHLWAHSSYTCASV